MTNAATALITGASSGFGRLTAQTMAARGYRVVATMRDIDGRNAGAATELTRLATDDGLPLRVAELDVCDERSVQRAVDGTLTTEGGIDVVINNAGSAVHGMLETITVTQAEAIFDTNLFGVLRVNRAVLPHMRERGSGLLLHVSSGLGRIIRPMLGMYCASKFALEAVAEAYRYEIAHLGIDCVIVEPGIFPTDFDAKAAPGTDAERASGYGAWTRELAVMRNQRDPQEVADAIADLADLPAGSRPMRTRVGGPETRFPGEVNAICEQVQEQMLQRSGLTEHVTLRLG